MQKDLIKNEKLPSLLIDHLLSEIVNENSGKASLTLLGECCNLSESRCSQIMALPNFMKAIDRVMRKCQQEELLSSCLWILTNGVINSGKEFQMVLDSNIMVHVALSARTHTTCSYRYEVVWFISAVINKLTDPNKFI